jgi:hypothetical protein
MPIKVVAGAEPENTNQFLIALAEVAQDSSIDGSEAVKRCLNGEEPGRGPIPRRKVSSSYITPLPELRVNQP